jgi:hypothetical protein
MKTYEIIPQSQANPAEWDFLVFTEKLARELVADHAIANGMVSGNTYLLGQAILTALDGNTFEGLRPAWLNTMGELCQNHADLERHLLRQYATLSDEAQSQIYYYAVALIEAQERRGN